MFKIFWVGEDEDTSQRYNEELPYGDETTWNMQNHEEDIGQIALDIVEHPDTLCIVAPVAGIELADIDVFMNKNILTIRGKRKRPEEIYNEDAIIKNSECFWGKFVRNVILPENLDFSQIKAMMENNLLLITIPKMRFHSHTVKIDRIDIDS